MENRFETPRAEFSTEESKARLMEVVASQPVRPSVRDLLEGSDVAKQYYASIYPPLVRSFCVGTALPLDPNYVIFDALTWETAFVIPLDVLRSGLKVALETERGAKGKGNPAARLKGRDHFATLMKFFHRDYAYVTWTGKGIDIDADLFRALFPGEFKSLSEAGQNPGGSVPTSRIRWSCALCHDFEKKWSCIGLNANRDGVIFEESLVKARGVASATQTGKEGSEIVDGTHQQPPAPVSDLAEIARCKAGGKHRHVIGKVAGPSRRSKKRIKKDAKSGSLVDDEDESVAADEHDPTACEWQCLFPWMLDRMGRKGGRSAVYFERRIRATPDHAAGVVKGARETPESHALGVRSAFPSLRGLQGARTEQLQNKRPWLRKQQGASQLGDGERVELFRVWSEKQAADTCARVPGLLQFLRKNLQLGVGAIQCVSSMAANRLSIVVQTPDMMLELASCCRKVLCIDGTGMGGFTADKKIMVYALQGNNRVYRHDSKAPKAFPYAFIVTVNDRTAATLAAALSHIKEKTERTFKVKLEFAKAVLDLCPTLFRAVRMTWRSVTRFGELFHGRQLWLGLIRTHKLGVTTAMVLVAWWYSWLDSESDMTSRSLALIFRVGLVSSDSPLRLTAKARADFTPFTEMVLFAFPESFCRYARSDLPKEFSGPGLIEAIFKLLKHDYGHNTKDLRVDDVLHILGNYQEMARTLRWGVGGDVDNARLGAARTAGTKVTVGAKRKVALLDDHCRSSSKDELPEGRYLIGMQKAGVGEKEAREIICGGRRADVHVEGTLASLGRMESGEGGSDEMQWGKKGSYAKTARAAVAAFISNANRQFKPVIFDMVRVAGVLCGGEVAGSARTNLEAEESGEAIVVAEESLCEEFLSGLDSSCEATPSITADSDDSYLDAYFGAAKAVEDVNLGTGCADWKTVCEQPQQDMASPKAASSCASASASAWLAFTGVGKPKLSLDDLVREGEPMKLRTAYEVSRGHTVWGTVSTFLASELSMPLSPCAVVAFIDVGLDGVESLREELLEKDEASTDVLLRFMRRKISNLSGGGDGVDMFLRVSFLNLDLYVKQDYKMDGWQKSNQEKARAVVHVVLPLNISAKHSKEAGVYVARRGTLPLDYIAKHRLPHNSAGWEAAAAHVVDQLVSQKLYVEKGPSPSDGCGHRSRWAFSPGAEKAQLGSYCLVEGGQGRRPFLGRVIGVDQAKPDTLCCAMAVERYINPTPGRAEYFWGSSGHGHTIRKEQVLAVLDAAEVVEINGESAMYASVSGLAVEDVIKVWLASRAAASSQGTL